MKHLKSLCAVITSLLLVTAFTACSNSDEPDHANQTPSDFVEAAKCDGTVKVVVSDEDTRAASTINPEVTNYTASCLSELWNHFTLVGYHGLAGEQMGIVQIVDTKTGKVKSEIDVLDARVNHVKYVKVGSKHMAVIGLDRKGKDGVLCGIIAVEIQALSGDRVKFLVDGDTLTPYKVDGVSVNCICWPGANSDGSNVIFVAAGGNDKLADTGEAGFFKFGFNSENPTQLQLLAKKTGTNYRGYWISWDGSVSQGLMCYAYRTVEGNDLVWKIGVVTLEDKDVIKAYDGTFLDGQYCVETEVFRKENADEDFGRFSVTSFFSKSHNYVISSAGKGGVKVYHHNKLVDNDSFEGTDAIHRMDLKAEWDKTCVHTTKPFAMGDRYYMFAATGAGCYKVALDVNPSKITVDLVPIGRRVPATTEDGYKPSTNYVENYGSGASTEVHVAGGYEGFYKLPFNSPEFVEAKD